MAQSSGQSEGKEYISAFTNIPAEDTATHVTIRVKDVIWEPHRLKTTSLIHFL